MNACIPYALALSNYPNLVAGTFFGQTTQIWWLAPFSFGSFFNMNQKILLACVVALIQLAVAIHATASSPEELEAVYADTLRPFAGESVRVVNTSSLTGKVMCGYQGWFNAEGDGAGRDYHRWTRHAGRPKAGNIKVDLWPDLSEYGPNERFSTDLRRADGTPAEVFSSFLKPTVLRHFQWMHDYSIDGVFVQRFVTPLRDAQSLRHINTVLDHCRAGANAFGRAYQAVAQVVFSVCDCLIVIRRRVAIDPAHIRPAPSAEIPTPI